MNSFNVEYDEIKAVEFYATDYYNTASVKATTDDGAFVYVRYEWEAGKKAEIPASVVEFLANNGISVNSAIQPSR